MSANIRESLYQCLENKISLGNSKEQIQYIFLFKIKDDAVFNIKIHFDLASTFTATPINKKYNGYNQICFGNGTVHVNQGDNVVPFYKLNQAHFEHVVEAGNIANTITITNVDTDVDNNIASIEYRRIHDNGYYKYYAIVSYNQGSDKDKLASRNLIVRKEIIYGDFDELLSKKVNATEVTEVEPEKTVRITVVSQSTNDVSNGQYVDAEDNIFAYNIVAKDYSYTEVNDYAHTVVSASYLSKILGFSKEYAYDILAENTLGVGLRYVGTDSSVGNKYFFKVDNNGNTVIGNTEQTNKSSLHVLGTSSLDGDVTAGGKVTAGNVESADGSITNLTATNITATKVECGYTSAIKVTEGETTTTLLNITKNNNVYAATGELVASYTDSFEPENANLKLARIKDLSLYKGTDKVVKVGTITSGTWNGSTIENNYIATDLTGKSYNGINISNADNKIGFTNGSTKLTVSANSDYTLNTACTYDATDTVASDSTSLVTSGAVYTSVNAVDTKLGDQVTYSYDGTTGVLTITSKTTS